jgi:hypothetical protein
MPYIFCDQWGNNDFDERRSPASLPSKGGIEWGATVNKFIRGMPY